MAENVVSGRVVVKESGLGVADLLVVVHDVDPNSLPEEVRAAETAISVESLTHMGGTGGLPGWLGDRVGSRLTDARGAFHFSFQDAEYRIANAEERRPDLYVMVLAPEGPDVEPAKRILYQAPEIRFEAGRIEQYLIRIPAAALGAAGVTPPVDPAIAREAAPTVAGRVAESIEWRRHLRDETRKLAAERISAKRAEVARTNALVEKKVLEKLTGVTLREGRARNIIAADARPEPVVRKAAQRRIQKVNNGPAPVGYLVLTREEAKPFRTTPTATTWRTNIPSAEIDPILFRAGEAAGRPATWTRGDPLEAACRLAVKGTPITTSVATDAGGTTTNGPGTADTDETPVAAEDLPRFVGRIINGMKPVLESGVGGNGRPGPTEVQRTLTELKVPQGPADVTAFHDYHNLQIAFEYVWKQYVNEDVVETAQTLARTIQEGGGDALRALETGADPIVALKEEAQVMAMAMTDVFGDKRPGWARNGDLIIADPTQPPKLGGGGGTNPDDNGATTPGGGGKRTIDDVVRIREEMANWLQTAPHELLGELESMLGEAYRFDVFAPGSVNFGLLVTYRQEWEPVTYQCGDLVNTLTLTPKETRRVTTKRVVKRERSVKETETNLRNRQDESKQTMRADAEVVEKASTKTNFNQNAKGSYNFLIADGDSNTTFDRTAEAASQETKKSFHENVMNAAMQLRSEKTWSFESKDIFEDEVTESTEITNPNDELTCTYLFYELERRYRVSERLHRLTPVVLVAMETPTPGRKAIDRVLLAHSWIINRVLLDDRYRAPLEYLCNRLVGEELGLAQMAQNVAEIRLAVNDLTKMHRDLRQTLFDREWHLNRAILTRAQKVAGENSEGVLEGAWEWVTGQGSEEDLESARVIEDLAREKYERSIREEKELRMRLDAETATLSAASQAYAKAYAEHMNRRMEVAGLRAHFKENMLYYMQAVWSFTFKDQLFFHLYKVKAPVITAPARTYTVKEVAEPPLSLHVPPGALVLEVTADPAIEAPLSVTRDAVTLAEIADLDRPLGFKGNYMIFPLKRSNPLTDMMMMPYVDTELGLHDPDEFGAWSPEQFAQYARCLMRAHRNEGDTAAQLKALENQLEDRYRRLVSSPHRVSDEVVVPTNSLYIEALPGTHPLLENFKLEHRLLDVEKAREEARKLKLESLRYAARILDETFDDPEIDKHIVIKGDAEVTVPAET